MPTLSIINATTTEGNSGTHTVGFDVNLSAASSTDVTVHFATADGTATVADHDYVAASSTLVIPAGFTTGTILVTIKGDTKVEADENFFVNLSNPVGATIATAQAKGIILNDDTAPPPSGSVSVITDPFDSSKKALEIIGTDNKDTITVTKSGSSQGKAVVKINGVNKGTFSFSGIILVYGKDGDDNISIDSGITRSPGSGVAMATTRSTAEGEMTSSSARMAMIRSTGMAGGIFSSAAMARTSSMADQAMMC